MKINYSLAALLFAASLNTGCSNDNDEILNEGNDAFEKVDPQLMFFAPDDGASTLGGKAIDNVRKLLQKTGPDIAQGYGEINITPEEAEEIKVFTDSLVMNCADDKAKFETIFHWLYQNLEYKHEYEGGDFISNDPYPVFKTRVAICQGFSNLQHIMLESQNIPTLNINGQYIGVGGHAWNYVYFDGKWTVSDATNNSFYPIIGMNSYKHLEPHSIDANLFETDDCAFTFSDKQLNVNEIKFTGSQFVVPYSAGGYKVTSLNPRKPVPTSIKEIYIGKNIKDFGLYYRGLDKNAPSIEAAYVDPENRYLKSYSGAVYKNSTRNLYIMYLPAALKFIEFLPMKVFEKNTVFEHENIEEIIIPLGTEEICDYAFEKCPNLRIAHIPSGVKVAEKAFYNVHPDFKIIREDLTGIPEIRL